MSDDARRFEYDATRQRSDIIRSFLRFLDSGDTSGPVGHDEEEVLAPDEANDVDPDTSGGQVDDTSDVDGGSDLGPASDQGHSDARVERVGRDVDEGVTGGPDRSPEPASDVSVGQATTERIVEADYGDKEQLSEPASVFGAFQHIPRATQH